MSIIDFRVRPPFKSFLDCRVFNNAAMENWAARFGVPLGKSAYDKTMDSFFQDMEEAGISQAVVAGNIRLPIGSKNSDIEELAQLYPDKLICVPCVNPQEPQAALQEIEQYVVQGHCQGIMMEPGYCEVPILADDKKIYPIYEYCQAHHIPVLMSIGGFCAPDKSFNDPIQADHIAADFPDLKIALCHASWPYVTEACHVAMNRSNVYLSPDMYVFNCPGAQDYIAGANYMIRDKIMFGSAYPIFSMGKAVEYYLNCGIKEESLPFLMELNAKRFFEK